jgi:hypothetical protein
MSNAMIAVHVPTNLLPSLGRLMVADSRLEYTLRMTIRSLTGVDATVALDATRRDGPATLREQIKKLGLRRLREGTPLLQLQALMQRCEDVSARRNEYVHAIWGQELDGDPVMNMSGQQWRSPPTPPELDALAASIDALLSELNEARLQGWLKSALESSPLMD